MSCWRQKRPLRHLAWKWGKLPFRPREEQRAGNMNCNSLTATHLTFPLPEENLEFSLIQEQQTAQGQTKRQNSIMCNSPCCFMGTLVSSKLISLFLLQE